LLGDDDDDMDFSPGNSDAASDSATSSLEGNVAEGDSDRASPAYDPVPFGLSGKQRRAPRKDNQVLRRSTRTTPKDLRSVFELPASEGEASDDGAAEAVAAGGDASSDRASNGHGSEAAEEGAPRGGADVEMEDADDDFVVNSSSSAGDDDDVLPDDISVENFNGMRLFG
jgi:hypothetical protein